VCVCVCVCMYVCIYIYIAWHRLRISRSQRDLTIASCMQGVGLTVGRYVNNKLIVIYIYIYIYICVFFVGMTRCKCCNVCRK
jgi:hypothetical protein